MPVTVLFAGVDLGTTSVKGAVFDMTGTMVRRASAPLSVSRPEANLVEQDPDELARAVEDVLDSLWPFNTGAIVGQINTHILVDDAGRAITPAVSWADRRAASLSEGPWGVTSLVSRVRWWQVQEPQKLRHARWAMLPRDYVLFRLTGTAATDATSWPDLADGGAWRADLPDEARRLLPALETPLHAAGSYRGAPLATGCMDAVAAAIGCGPTPPGTAIDVSGTSETAGVVCAGQDRTAAVRRVMPLPDGYWHAGPTQAGGLSLDWAQRLLRPDGGSQAVLALAAQVTEPTGIVFLPYLDGERMPLWDPRLTGVLAGLTFAHDAHHVARAVLEGVAFAIRHILDCATPPGSPPARRLIVCGGGARSGFWNQIKADVTGLLVEVPSNVDTGVTGAAMLSASCLTGMTLAEARTTLAAARQHLTPEVKNTETYSNLWHRYVELGQVMQHTGAER